MMSKFGNRFTHLKKHESRSISKTVRARTQKMKDDIEYFSFSHSKHNLSTVNARICETLFQHLHFGGMGRGEAFIKSRR